MSKEILKKIDMFISDTFKFKVNEEQAKIRPIQFRKWWGDFRPGDRVDAIFDEDYISLAGTNAEGNFAGVKKEMTIEDENDMDDFVNGEGDIWGYC